MKAGLRYGALAFLAGLALGVVREWLLAPRIGATAAGLVDAAAMALLLWLAAERSLPADAEPQDRLAMGATALALVLVAEQLLGLVFDATGLAAQRAPRSLAEQELGLALLGWLAALPFLLRRR